MATGKLILFYLMDYVTVSIMLSKVFITGIPVGANLYLLVAIWNMG